MSKINFTFVDAKVSGNDVGVLNLYVGGKLRQVREDHPNFKHIRNALRDNDSEDVVVNLIEGDVVLEEQGPTFVEQNVGKVRVDANGDVFYDDIKVDEPVADRVKAVQALGLPIGGYANFLNKLYNNVSFRVRKELLAFIERNGLTITDDGFILAYKAVRQNWYDKWSGRILNTPGTTVEMDRGKVNDDHRRGCSSGLHAGALEYVYSYGYGSDRIVIVKIDPEDVVSVPSDCRCQKLRTCKYHVIGEYQGELNRGLYSAEHTARDMYELDEEDDYDDFDWESLEDDYDDWNDDEELVEDYFEEGDVTVTHNDGAKPSVQKDNKPKPTSFSMYGLKPSGQRYHNVRDKYGRFVRN